MTTVTITDRAVTFAGHAGDRAVCISLAALSQALAAIIGDSESKAPGAHVIGYTPWDEYTGRDVVDAIAAIVQQLAAQFPLNVACADAR